MGPISKWLLHDDQKALWEILVAGALNLAFFALIAPLFWALDTPMLALRLAKGYAVLWLTTIVVTMLSGWIQRYFRVDIYTCGGAYVVSGIAASCLLQAGWAAFAALGVEFAGDTPMWMAAILYLAGALSCVIAFFVVSAFYHGTIYRLASLPVALASFIIFSVWPSSAHVLYGWYFDVFS